VTNLSVKNKEVTPMLLRKLLARRGWFIGGFVTALLLIAVVCRYPPSFDETLFDTLRDDMTRQEVATLLGCPPGDYRPAIWRHPDWYISTSDMMGLLVKECGRSTSEVESLRQREVEEWLADLKVGKEIRAKQGMEQLAWRGKSSEIKVIFNKDGQMIHRSFWSLFPPRPPHDAIRYVQWWLGW
jgi:hypothetical protein